MSGFEKFRFGDVLEWIAAQTVKIKLRFQIFQSIVDDAKTTTVTGTSLNKRFNQQYSGYARALKILGTFLCRLRNDNVYDQIVLILPNLHCQSGGTEP